MNSSDNNNVRDLQTSIICDNLASNGSSFRCKIMNANNTDSIWKKIHDVFEQKHPQHHCLPNGECPWRYLRDVANCPYHSINRGHSLVMNSIFAIFLVFFSACVHTEVEVKGGVKGYVLENGTSKPIAGVLLLLNPGDNSVYTFEDGAFTITDLDMGSYTIDVTCKGYVPKQEEITIQAGKTLNKDILLTPAIAPTTVTIEASTIGTTTAVLKGGITDKGNMPITDCGFYLGENKDNLMKYASEQIDTTTLVMAVGGLKSKTPYYFQAYATNDKGESRGEIKSFTTLDTSKPIVLTNNAKSITGTSATIQATISDNGGCEILEYGFYIGVSEQSLMKQKVDNLLNTTFSFDWKNLQDGTTYYFQAYAINEKGESKGEINTFVTHQLALPIVLALNATNISYTSAILNAEITSNGSSTISDYGFYWGIYTNPTTPIKVGESDIQKFSYELKNLSPNTTYYYKAYAKNDKGEGVSEIISFQTMAYTIPQVTTSSAQNVSSQSANCYGTITNTGGQTIIECGVCYSTSSQPTINDQLCVSSSNNQIVCVLQKLVPSTKYYYRAYAKNSQGVGYGNVYSFTTGEATYGIALDGEFSISATKKVRFSGGNLRYNPSTDVWQFAKHQYDAIGEDNKNISSSYAGWIDLFGWGTGNQPTQTSEDWRDYSNTFYDWGDNDINGVSGQWRTLSKDEWNYLLKSRTNARYKNVFAIVCNVPGWLLLPDNWTLPSGISMDVGNASDDGYITNFSSNTYNSSQWNSLESAGAVFLPITGIRVGVRVSGTESDAEYWTSTDREGIFGHYEAKRHAERRLYQSHFSTVESRPNGLAVRLVQDI